MSNNNIAQKNGGQRGNALFLILIAVALFAALSYAITSSGRGSGSVDKETSMISAGAIVQYPAGLRTAVTRMLITGTPRTGATGINTTTSPTGQTFQLFDTLGGGATIQPPSATAVDATITAWVFLDASAAANGNYIVGLGTDANVSGRDILAILGATTVGGALSTTLGVTLPVCQAILKGLGVTAANYTTPSHATAAVFSGVAAATNTVTGAANSLLLTGNLDAAFTPTANGNNASPFYCFSNTTAGGAAPYSYYHALSEG